MDPEKVHDRLKRMGATREALEAVGGHEDAILIIKAEEERLRKELDGMGYHEVSRLLTIKEASQVLGLSRPRVDQLVQAGRFTVILVGRMKMIPRDEVEKHVALPVGRQKKHGRYVNWHRT